ncbi:TetR/AcrR family transcriptional regulator [Longispora albida]|uniref:TetR/AcrR family transcriptional regulator n=1 Tax=Longispora albida TaxID=203523 RepID=UPI00037DBC80|nr:TetR/AcrR family transcriptional regulator [Longispora albida]
MKQAVSSRSALLDTAIALLHERGWSALNLESIAERAGVSRATVWRAGLTRSAVERILREQLAADYRELMWVPLTGPGPGDQRLTAALLALCAVAERNLPLLAHTETAFHGPDLDAAGIQLDYFGPWLRILELAAADGSLPMPEDPYTFIGTLSNAVLLTYVHLRAYHAQPGDTAEHTARQVVNLLANGYLPR